LKNNIQDGGLPNPFRMALPRLVSSFLNSAFVIISLPVIVLAFAPPEQKGTQLGLISSLSVILTIFTLLGVAYASDSLPGRRVRRKPFIAAGHLLVLPAVVLFYFTFSYVALVFGVLFMVAARSAIDAAHLPMLNDLIPERLRGRFSAPISLLGIMGIVTGAVLAAVLAQEAEYSGDHTSFLIPLGLGAAATALGAAFIFTTKVKEPQREAQPSRLMELLRSLGGKRERGYLWFMIARTVYLVGIFAVVLFFVYIVQDLYKQPDFKLKTGLYYAVSILGAMLFTLPAGALSDRLGCLPVVLISGVVQAIACFVVFVLGPTADIWAYIGIFFFGGAFGGIFASSLALSTKLIPRQGDAAKYMSLLVVSTYVSQLIASLAGGFLYDYFNRFFSFSGPPAIFVLAELCFLLGGLFFLKLEEPPSRPHE
jgi:MFS family permease